MCMKKIFMLIASAFLFANVHASNVEKIQFANAGEFSLGLMVGVPTVSLGVPFFSVDGMVESRMNLSIRISLEIMVRLT